MNSEQHLLSVLIVDDEPFIREGLCALIDWKAEGYIITDKAENGQQALELIKEKQYDLVITDICMPVMDGIELIKKVKEELSHKPYFIILSGFYEYQYTRYAIQYGCSDYILKPIQKDELTKTLRRIYEEINQNVDDIDEYEKAFFDRNILAIIRGKYDNENLIHAKELLKQSDHVAYAHFELNSYSEKFSSLTEDEKRELQKKLYRTARIMLKDYCNHVIMDVINAENSYDIGLIYCETLAKENNSTDEEWITNFAKKLSERLGYEVTACYGSLVEDLEHMSESFREAELTRYFRIFGKEEEAATIVSPIFNKKKILFIKY